MKPKRRRKAVMPNKLVSIDYGYEDETIVMIKWIGDNAFEDENLPECCKGCSNLKNMMSYGCNCTLPLFEERKKEWWTNVY